MRKFKTTPQKKFVGMIILFVGIPLFILAYIFLVLKWRPGFDTVIISAAIAILALYFYLQYKKQLALQDKAQAPLAEESLGEEPLDEEPLGEEPLDEESLPEDHSAEDCEVCEVEEILEEKVLGKVLPGKKVSKKK